MHLSSHMLIPTVSSSVSCLYILVGNNTWLVSLACEEAISAYTRLTGEGFVCSCNNVLYLRGVPEEDGVEG